MRLTSLGLLAAAAPSCAAALHLLGSGTLPWWLARIGGGRWLSPTRRLTSWDAYQKRLDGDSRRRRQRVRVLLIRHGESMANLNAARIVGGRDVSTPLSLAGERQAELLGERLRREGLKPATIYASHAVRARRTAEIACTALGLGHECIEIEPRLVEFSQGELEKRERAEVYRADGPVRRGLARHSMFYRPPGRSPDGDRGESQWDVEVRMREFIEAELLSTPHRSDNELEKREQRVVALFSHGIAIRAFVRGALGAADKFVVRSETNNTSITELLYVPEAGDLGGWRLVRFNDAAHLAGGVL